ncbi:MAG: acetyl-CoA carboxylase carboxyltransferase subunit alpha [Kiritimatiellae bacterium]|nr:acetyl-CoA carboxylase carboxyltransferase subunit alpha [Kiritimatiellia bacterium]
MSWLTERKAEAKIRPVTDLWAVCPSCKAHVERPVWNANLKVCPKCNGHDRLSCRERIELLADPGSFKEQNANIGFNDPLDFTDASGKYADKAKATAAKTGIGEAVVTGTATMGGRSVALAVMDFRFLGGSLGSGTGERILLATEMALARRLPLIIVSASGGARMHEGIVSLMQMAKTCAGIARLQEAGLPYISVLTDPTTGGVSASYAMVGDIHVAEPKSLIGFAGRRVIEQTIKQKLPDDFQTAEYLEAHGFLDSIVARKELRAWLVKVLGYYRPEQPKSAARKGGAKAVVRNGRAKQPSAWDSVQLARHAGRPTIRDYIANCCDDFVELHGDRAFGDDHGIIGGFATIGGVRLMLLGHQKGKNVEENIASNFGMANPEGYRKAMRLMKLAEKYGLPVVSFVDTPGAYPGLDAEARGQAEAIARNLTVMAALRTPFLVVVTGEGGSGGALGIGVGDRVMMLQNAVYSVISPEGCASILWRDGKKAPEAAEALKITAGALLGLGIIDEIVPEPAGGAHADPAKTMTTVKDAVVAALTPLLAIPVEELVAKRYDKFAAMGRVEG